MKAGEIDPFADVPTPRFEAHTLEKSALNWGFNTEQAKKFDRARMKHFKVNEDPEYPKVKKLCEGYVRNFGNKELEGLGLYLYSDNPGSGKTMMGCIVANELFDAVGASSQVITMKEIFSRIQATFKAPELSKEAILNKLKWVDVLIVDEIGFESETTSWKEEIVFELIEIRYSGKRPTIFTSNSSISDLPYHPRIKSRITEMTVQVEFPDYDFRALEGKRKQSLLLKKIK